MATKTIRINGLDAIKKFTEMLSKISKEDKIAEAIEEENEFLEGESCPKCGDWQCNGYCK